MVEVISTLVALSSLILRATTAMQRISQMVAAAQREGRDLTEAEINEIRAQRARAVAKWDEVK